MGWKNIKQTYCPDFDVYVDRKEKDIQILYYGSKVLTISTINFEVKAEPIVKASYPLKSLLIKLVNATKKGELKRLYDTPDNFEKNLPVYTVKGNKIMQELCGTMRNDALCNLPVMIGLHCQQTGGTTSQLNPLFVTEMMGFPLDWLTSPFQSGDRNQ